MKIDVSTASGSTAPRTSETHESTREILVDYKETPTTVEVNFDAPDVEAKELDVTLKGQTLTVGWEREVESETVEGDRRRIEKRTERRKKQVDLPCEVLTDDVDAVLKGGRLKVTLRKKDTGGAVKVNVR